MELSITAQSLDDLTHGYEKGTKISIVKTFGKKSNDEVTTPLTVVLLELLPVKLVSKK